MRAPQAPSSGTTNEFQFEKKRSEPTCRGNAAPESSAHGGEGDGTDRALIEGAGNGTARGAPAVSGLDGDDSAEHLVTPHRGVRGEAVITAGEEVFRSRA